MGRLALWSGYQLLSKPVLCCLSIFLLRVPSVSSKSSRYYHKNCSLVSLNYANLFMGRFETSALNSSLLTSYVPQVH